MGEAIFDLAAVDDAELLRPTPFLQSDHPEVIRFARETTEGATDPVEQAVRLYYAVRDGIRYDPYHIPRDEEGYRAATVLREQAAVCIPKANLLAAAARALAIPSAVGFADVKNHLTTEKLRRTMGSDLFVYNGFTALKLEGRWIKATPAFNLSLCEKFDLRPLEFDGSSDAQQHPFDNRNRRHMEYVKDRGCFGDFPFGEVMAAFKTHYPGFSDSGAAPGGRFEDEKPLTS